MSAPLSEEELAAIEAREKTATPGPWTWDYDKIRGTELKSGDEGVLWSTMPWHDTTDIDGCAGDEAFIAAARSDVPRLLSEVRRLRQKIADMEAANREQIRRADEIAGVPS